MSEPFVRRVELTAGPGAVVATIEDYNHHFDVAITHDGAAVTGVRVDPVRAPWSECAGAGAELAALVGVPLGVRPNVASPDHHCTHQLDVACVGVRFAGTGLDWRRYDVTVAGWDEEEVHATVERDDGHRVAWTLDRFQTITGPDPFTGRTLGAGFTPWVIRELDDDTAEAALILRRAAWMAPSRGFDLDAFASLDQTGLGEGVCFATQPERIRRARRNVGMARVTLRR